MSVKRLQIMIEEELDAALARQAAEEGVSKAALIRRYVGERLRPLPPLEEDPLWEIVGMVKGRPDDSASVDDVVYGPKRPSDLRRHVVLDRSGDGRTRTTTRRADSLVAQTR